MSINIMSEFKYSILSFVGWAISFMLGGMHNFIEWLPVINGVLQSCVLLTSLVLALIGLYKSVIKKK